MDVESASMIVALVALSLMIGFVAAAEVSLASTSRSRVRELLEKGNGQARIIDSLLGDPARFLSTLLLLKSASYVAAGAIAFTLVWRGAGTASQIVVTVTVVWLIMIAIQIVGRAWTLRQPETVALKIGKAIQVIAVLLAPLSWLLRRLGARVRGSAEEAAAESIFLSEDGLRFLINVGEGEGTIEEEEKRMIAGIFELGETAVREIMVPRLDVVAVDVESSLTAALDVIIEYGHSRIPVYEENIDHVIGVLYAKDLLRCFREGQTDVPIRQLLRRAYFVPESKKLDDLFGEMQTRHVHIAVVVDEYGGTAGLVTIEDLLEEIVGEIQDEYDREEPLVQRLGPDTFVFNARYDLDEVSELIGVDLTAEHESIDTLGGFIYSRLGRVPGQGEMVEYKGWRFIVLSIDARRIEQVRVEPIEPSASAQGEAQLPNRADQTNDAQKQGFLSSAA